MSTAANVAYKPLHVIVNADDFGITRTATDAIVRCHEAGSVTSTSFMSTLEAAAYAAEAARSVPELGIGLHFNLTLGEPACAPRKVASLLGPDGRFLSRGGILSRAARCGLSLAEIEAELVAQWQRMRDLGLSPTHIDSHQHVHALAPQVYRVVARFAAQQRLPLRVPWRWRGRAHNASLKRKVKVQALHAVCGVGRALAPRVPSNDGFCSVFDLNVPPASLTHASYLELLAPYRSGCVELMVHPAENDAELATKTAIGAVSGRELELLASPAFAEALRARNIRLVTYRHLTP